MIIQKVRIKDFRIYKGLNEIAFTPRPELVWKRKNIHLISGENGFGKTTFLTSLVWCLYGKLIVDVDEEYKRAVYEAGGYKKYAANNLNRSATDPNEYSVSIILSEIFIPSIPCQEVKITRIFNLRKKEDQVEILIDGSSNELTKEVGSEIFINDFILPKEIAKFFFFDAEKVAALAEMKSTEAKQKLSRAYSEVLGIKKYIDLRNNLTDLRLRFTRDSATEDDRKRFTVLQKDLSKLRELVNFSKEKISNLQEEKESKKRQSEHYQEKLIREGSTLSVQELVDIKKLRDSLSEEGKVIKLKLKELLELAPFAISGGKLKQTKDQAEKEASGKANRLDLISIKKKSENITLRLKENEFSDAELDPKVAAHLLKAVDNYILREFSVQKKDHKVLLEFSETEHNEFIAVWENLKYSYSNVFKKLLKAEKVNKIAFNKVVRKISNAESKEDDLLIQEIKRAKSSADERTQEIEKKIAELNQDIGSFQREIAVLSRQISELNKRIRLDESDKQKDVEAEELINYLDNFIEKLKADKKGALGRRIKVELNHLMHKIDFIDAVDIVIKGEILDINLYDSAGQSISKESLSKGEQQLYATSILKALVDESNVKFPIFIDSPLQKFDKKHSKSVIKDFYPNISDQVVLLPLLEKELSLEEFQLLLPNISSTFLIKNKNSDSSEFEKVVPPKLFDKYNEYVYQHQDLQ
ncbi:MAG: DNA sulfur modification protein DndD [Ekhidna sp.]|nr:DNA sulfur modification protein DndD [Ekhidna sp.]